MSTTNIETVGNPSHAETTEVTGTVENAPSENQEGVVGTILELGFAWAAYGLKIATTAVEQAARVLGITAKSLDKLAEELAAKSGVTAKEVATK
jgi:hypothetical protein